MRILLWLKRELWLWQGLIAEWKSWRSAWQQIRQERRRHEEEKKYISVPWKRYCDLLLAEERLRQTEERSRVLAINLAIERGKLIHEQRLSEVLGAIVFQMEECDSQKRDVSRLEQVSSPPARKGFDS